MAVQMTASSTQEFLAFSTGGERGGTTKDGDASLFKASLVSVSRDDGTKVDARRPNDAPARRGTQVAAKDKPNRTANGQAAQNKQAAPLDAEAAEVKSEIESLLADDALSEADLKGIIALLGQEYPEVDIDEMIAAAQAEAQRSTRFDPDAILAALGGAAEASDEASEETGEAADDAQLATMLQQVAPDDKAAAAAVEIAPEQAIEVDAQATDDSATELLVGRTDDGEVAIKQPELQPTDADVAEPDAEPAAATAVKPVDVKHEPAKKTQLPEAQQVVSEQVESAPTQSAHVAAHEAGKLDVSKVGEQGESESLDKKIAELMTKYREERERRANDGGADARQPSQNMASKDKRPTLPTAPRRAAETRTTEHADARASQITREVPFGETLASKLRDAATAAYSAEETAPSRAGMIYDLDRGLAFDDGMKTVLEFMHVDSVQEARIVVEPPALGHIDVSLRATESGMEAAFKVDNEHLKQMVAQHIEILKSSLENQGIHVSNIAVDIKNKDEQNSGHGAAHAKNGKKGRGVRGIEDGDEEGESQTQLVRLDLEAGRLHWVG